LPPSVARSIEEIATDAIAAAAVLERPKATVGEQKPEPEKASTLQAAIDKITRAMLVVEDVDIPALVLERAALRAELRALREASAGVVNLADRRREV
jgi:hypothetical protein